MQDRQTPRFAFALFLNTTFRQSLMLLFSVGLVLGAVLLGYLLALPSNPEAHLVGRYSLNRLLLLGGPLLLSLGCGGLLVKAVKDRPWARTPARSSWVIRRVALRAGRRLRYPCRSAAARQPPRRGERPDLERVPVDRRYYLGRGLRRPDGSHRRVRGSGVGIPRRAEAQRLHLRRADPRGVGRRCDAAIACCRFAGRPTSLACRARSPSGSIRLEVGFLSGPWNAAP